jgi:hypothetical protein
MSDNDSGTSESQSAENEHVVAVAAHGDFGTEMLAKNAIKKVLEVVEKARDQSGFDIDRIAYPEGEMGGDVVQQAFKRYNASLPDDQQIPGMPIASPWDDTDGKDEMELRERQDGTKYWIGAPEFRDEMLARKADRLVVVEEGDFTDRIITEFQKADKPVYNHDVETMEVPDVDL